MLFGVAITTKKGYIFIKEPFFLRLKKSGINVAQEILCLQIEHITKKMKDFYVTPS
jgi:hypothetical protein